MERPSVKNQIIQLINNYLKQAQQNGSLFCKMRAKALLIKYRENFIKE